MDVFVKGKLKEWKLENFILRFETAGIDEEIFKYIDDDMLNVLFEKQECGFKKKFETKFKEWLDDNKKLESSMDKTTTHDIKFNIPDNSLSFNESNICNLENYVSLHANPIINPENIPIIDVGAPLFYLQKLSVLQLLKCTTRGKIILATFQLEKQVNSRLLSDLIIEHEFDSTGVYRIKKERFAQIAAEIGNIFATDTKPADKVAELYFYRFRKYVNNRSRVFSAGILYDKWCKYHQKLIHCKLVDKKKEVQKEKSMSSDDEKVIWLQNNDEPKSVVIAVWKETFGSRKHPKDLEQYFSSYKCLRSPYGHDLLALDFDATYPLLSENLKDNWNTVAQLIIDYSEKKKKLNSSDHKLIEAGKKNALAFLLLPRILGVLVRKRKAADRTYGSLPQDVQNSVILNVQSSEELNSYKQNLNEIFDSGSNKIGPYVAVIGDLSKDGQSRTDENCDINVLVVIKGLNFPVENNQILHAIDHCYKAHFALEIDFPSHSKHVWEFLRLYVYKNEVPKAKPYIAINNLIEELDKLKRNSNCVIKED